MAGVYLLAAGVDKFQRDVAAAATRGHLSSREALMAVTIAVAVGVVLFLLVYVRYRLKQQKAARKLKSGEPRTSETVQIDPETGKLVRRRRKRRRRRDHRPRNPTLDKTGGLPPPRTDDELPKF
jgi:hypothetical protein